MLGVQEASVSVQTAPCGSTHPRNVMKRLVAATLGACDLLVPCGVLIFGIGCVVCVGWYQEAIRPLM